MRQDLVSKSGETMFRYHPGGNFPQQYQHTSEYLSQVAALQGPYGEPGVVQQHGSPTAWSGTSHLELAPTVSSTISGSHNSIAGSEQWGYNHGTQQPHLASPGSHLSGSPTITGMAGYVHHDGYMAHTGHHGPESVAQALYTPSLKGTYDYYVRTPTYRYNPQTGKTRTKDKYRVVYTDHQRQKLEEEFRYNRYITIRRKAEIAIALGLSDRQVKIWFQNRRAKERKLQKKLQHVTSGQQEKNKAPPQESARRETSVVKLENNKATIKQEGSQQPPHGNTKHNTETTMAGVSRVANDATVLGDNGISETKYVRNEPLKSEYGADDGVRVTAYTGVVVSPGHITAGNFPVQREPILQYTHA